MSIIKEKFKKRIYGGTYQARQGWLSKVSCDNCGRVQIRHRSQTIPYRFHFCDRECKGQYMRSHGIGRNIPWH